MITLARNLWLSRMIISAADCKPLQQSKPLESKEIEAGSAGTTLAFCRLSIDLDSAVGNQFLVYIAVEGDGLSVRASTRSR